MNFIFNSKHKENIDRFLILLTYVEEYLSFNKNTFEVTQS